MTGVRTFNLGGREVRGIEQDFEIVKEDWSAYRLLDGGEVRLKTTVLQIIRVVDEHDKPAFGPDGSPAFVVNHKSDASARP